MCNESKEPNFEHKHKIREAEGQAVAKSTEEHRGAENPAKTLSGAFRASFSYNASQ